VSISVRKPRFSHHLISEYGEFTVNLPRVQDLEAVKYCGTKSGRDCNKFADLKLTPLPCPPLKHAPMIAEFFHTLACRVHQVIELGTHDLFIAEVVGVYHREEDRRTSRPNPHCEEQLVFLDAKFWRLAEINL
jgi:flavin reductase (DIM6/NTAB) family NADH-FMN oxidoreductase RutF